MENPALDTNDSGTKVDLGEIENGVTPEKKNGISTESQNGVTSDSQNGVTSSSKSGTGLHSGKVSPSFDNGLPAYDGPAPSGGKKLERVLSVEDEVEERRRAQREKEPFIYIRWIVNRPKTWFCRCLNTT